MLALSVENLWQISERQDVWLGLHHSVATTDRSSDLYWTPYWDQRHYLVTRIRRGYPNYFGMLQLHLGVQKEKARADVKAKYEQLRIQGETQGFYPGEDPEQDWSAFLGASANASRKWSNGLELALDFSVNAMRDYTERNASLTLMYHF